MTTTEKLNEEIAVFTIDVINRLLMMRSSSLVMHLRRLVLVRLSRILLLSLKLDVMRLPLRRMHVTCILRRMHVKMLKLLLKELRYN